MTFTFLVSTCRTQWRWAPYFHRDGPRILKNGRRYFVFDIAWLCFYIQIDNDG